MDRDHDYTEEEIESALSRLHRGEEVDVCFPSHKKHEQVLSERSYWEERYRRVFSGSLGMKRMHRDKKTGALIVTYRKLPELVDPLILHACKPWVQEMVKNYDPPEDCRVILSRMLEAFFEHGNDEDTLLNHDAIILHGLTSEDIQHYTKMFEDTLRHPDNQALIRKAYAFAKG